MQVEILQARQLVMVRDYAQVNPAFDYSALHFVWRGYLQADFNLRFFPMELTQYLDNRGVGVGNHIVGQPQGQFADQTAVSGVDIGTELL